MENPPGRRRHPCTCTRWVQRGLLAWLGLVWIVAPLVAEPAIGRAEHPRAEPGDDAAAIHRVIADYVRCWREADEACLAEVFALEGRVLWRSVQNGRAVVLSMTFAEVLTRREAQPGYGRTWEVRSLEVIDGVVASARVWIERRGGSYDDVLALHQIDGSWRIVSKTFASRTHDAGTPPQWPTFGHPHGSPRGDRIVVDCGAGTLDLCVVEVPGGGVRRVTVTPTINEAVPVFSRDGTRLAYSRARGDGWYLAVLDLTTGEVRELLRLTMPHATRASWAPGDERLVFDKKNDDGDFDLYTVRPDGTDLQVLVGGPGDQRFGSLSPDGSRLAYADITRGDGAAVGDVMVAQADGTDPRPIAQSPADEGVPLWAPDGRSLSLYSRRDGNFEVYLVTLGGEVRRLTDHPAFDIFGTFAPDGRSLVFESTRDRDPGGFDRGADLYRVDLATGAVARLTTPGDFPRQPE